MPLYGKTRSAVAVVRIRQVFLAVPEFLRPVAPTRRRKQGEKAIDCNRRRRRRIYTGAGELHQPIRSGPARGRRRPDRRRCRGGDWRCGGRGGRGRARRGDAPAAATTAGLLFGAAPAAVIAATATSHRSRS